MTDKVEQTPADDSKPLPTPDPSKGAAGTGTPSVDVNQILAENARLKEREGVLTKSYGEIRSFATKKAQEAAALRKQLESGGDLDLGEPPAKGGSDPTRDRMDVIEGRQATIDFRLDHPDYNTVIDEKSGKTVWGRMQDLLDESNPESAYLAGATPYLTLRNAYREVQLELARAERAKSPSQGATQQRTALRVQALVSGQSATDGGESIDLDDPNLTAEDILKIGIESGLFKIDQSDPPLALKRLLKK